MNLQELAERTSIPIRRLRHCLDEGLIPGLKIESGDYEIGRRRHFDPTVGFALCCAATLVEAGIDRSTVRVFLGGLAKLKFPRTNKLVIIAIFARKAQAFAELGDNVNIRVTVESNPSYATGWMHQATGDRPGSNYQPLTTIGLNLGAIGRNVFNW